MQYCLYLLLSTLRESTGSPFAQKGPASLYTRYTDITQLCGIVASIEDTKKISSSQHDSESRNLPSLPKLFRVFCADFPRSTGNPYFPYLPVSFFFRKFIPSCRIVSASSLAICGEEISVSLPSITFSFLPGKTSFIFDRPRREFPCLFRFVCLASCFFYRDCSFYRNISTICPSRTESHDNIKMTSQ